MGHILHPGERYAEGLMLIWGLTTGTTAQNRIHLCSSHGNSNSILTQQAQRGNRTKVTACRMRTYFLCGVCYDAQPCTLSAVICQPQSCCNRRIYRVIHALSRCQQRRFVWLGQAHSLLRYERRNIQHFQKLALPKGFQHRPF